MFPEITALQTSWGSTPWFPHTSYGYVGIPVALIAALNPLAIIVSAIFFSGILTGTYGLELTSGIPIDVVTSVYGLVMFLAPLGVYLSLGKRRPTVAKAK